MHVTLAIHVPPTPATLAIRALLKKQTRVIHVTHVRLMHAILVIRVPLKKQTRVTHVVPTHVRQPIHVPPMPATLVIRAAVLILVTLVGLTLVLQVQQFL